MYRRWNHVGVWSMRVTATPAGFWNCLQSQLREDVEDSSLCILELTEDAGNDEEVTATSSWGETVEDT